MGWFRGACCVLCTQHGGNIRILPRIYSNVTGTDARCIRVPRFDSVVHYQKGADPFATLFSPLFRGRVSASGASSPASKLGAPSTTSFHYNPTTLAIAFEDILRQIPLKTPLLLHDSRRSPFCESFTTLPAHTRRRTDPLPHRMLNASASTPASSFFARVNGVSRSVSVRENETAHGAPSGLPGQGAEVDVRRAVSLRVPGSFGGARPRDVGGMSFGAAGSDLSSPLGSARSTSQGYSVPAAARHALFSHHASPPTYALEDGLSEVDMTVDGISGPPSPSPSVGSSGFSPASAFLSHFSSSGSLRSNSTETAADAQGARVLDYTLGALIGRGGFSFVRKAHHVVTGEVFACKIVKRDDLSDTSGSVERFEEEIRIWHSLPRHPGILPLLEMHRTPSMTFLITPFLPGGSLLDVLKREDGSDKTARKFFPGVVHAVSALHEGYEGFEGQLLHGDLKLDNFLVDHSGNVLVGDFYTAKSLLHPVTTPTVPIIPLPLASVPAPTPSFHGRPPRPPRHSEPVPNQIDGLTSTPLPSASLPYAPPELLRALAVPPSLAQDIWAIGILLHALLTGRLPFFDAYDPRLQMKILRGTFQLPERLGREWVECLQGCLDVNRETRWDIARVKTSDAVVGWQEVRGRRSKSRSRSRQRGTSADYHPRRFGEHHPLPDHRSQRDGATPPMAIRRTRPQSRASPAAAHEPLAEPPHTAAVAGPSRSASGSRSRSSGRESGFGDHLERLDTDISALSITRGRAPTQRRSFEEFPPIKEPMYYPSSTSGTPGHSPADPMRGYQPGASRTRSRSRPGDQYHTGYDRSSSRGYDGDSSRSVSRPSLSPSTSKRGSRSGSRSRNRNMAMSTDDRPDSYVRDGYDGYDTGSGLDVVREEWKAEEERGRRGRPGR